MVFSSAGDFKCAIKEEVTLTSGEWEVLARHGSKVGYSVSQIKTLIVTVQNIFIIYFCVCLRYCKFIMHVLPSI
jgi:hypothetical protein